jgi:hypothetical protein
MFLGAELKIYNLPKVIASFMCGSCQFHRSLMLKLASYFEYLFTFLFLAMSKNIKHPCASFAMKSSNFF